MCHNIPTSPQKSTACFANGCITNGYTNGYTNGLVRTGVTPVTSEKIEIFRGVSYYVIHEGTSASPYVILKKVN